MQSVILERREQVCKGMVGSPFFISLLVPLLHRSLSLCAGNLIKVTSSSLPHLTHIIVSVSCTLSVVPTLCSNLKTCLKLSSPPFYSSSCLSTHCIPLKPKKHVISHHSLPLPLCFSLPLSSCLFKPECVSCLSTHGSHFPRVAFPGFICLRAF